MKIARVFPTFQTDLLYAEHYIARELNKLDVVTTFITSDKYLSYWHPFIKEKNKSGTYDYPDYTVCRIPAYFPKEKAIFKDWKNLFKILFRSGFDVIHLLGVGTFTTIIVLFLSGFSKSQIPKVVISDHSDKRTHKREGILANCYYGIFAFLYKFFYNRVDRIITFSESSKQLLMQRFSLAATKFTVIPLGYDDETFYPMEGRKNKSDELVIGFAGKVTRSKRIDRLINLLYQPSCRGKLKIVIVGINQADEYCVELRRLVERDKLNVVLLPFADSRELAKFYNEIDVAVYPGGVSITTIEASGCGTPVVIYNSIEGLEERVNRGRGFLFDSDKELENIVADYIIKKSSGEIDNNRIALDTSEQFSWRYLVKQYLKVYNE